MDWQPIESAPKDGSRVKLKRRSGIEVHAEWRDFPSLFRVGPQWWKSERGEDPKLVDVPLDPVTHWSRPAPGEATP